ncbi:MAG TPA: alginate export family protein [Acidobacteriaceae bacterium]|nr:alginate export family protein [Acidobacteriaceae bacterium]
MTSLFPATRGSLRRNKSTPFSAFHKPLQPIALRRTSRSALAVCALLLTAAAPLCAQQRSNYADYPQKRGDIQPLQWTELPPWMTLGMELRGRTEGNTSYNYAQNGDRIYELTRVWGSMEVRPAKFLTGYIQFMDTHALGLPAHVVAANMRDNFDARQAFLNFHVKPGRVPIQAIAGRQELKFGSERVIGISDWTNNSRTFDGFDLRLGDKNRVDLFSTSVVAIHPYSLDKHGAGLTFHGAYGQITTWIPKVNLQPYVLLHDVRGVTSQQGTKGNEEETTFGLETSGKLPANLDYIVNASLQRGSYANDSIHAGQSFGKVSYSANYLPWKPRLGGEYDYATGNSHRNPYRIGTYDQEYPSNHNAFGLFDLFGYQNIRQERLNLDLGPTPNLTFLVQGEFLNLVNEHDNLYASGGTTTIKAPTAGFTTDQIGTGFDASGKYVYHNYLVANIGVGHFFPGALMLANSHGSAQTYAYFSLTYRYRVDKHAVPPPSQGSNKTNAASTH